MPANTTPIFPLTPKVGSETITVANFAKNGTTAIGALGTSPTFTTIFTAGANGSKIDQIKVRSLGLNVATVLRLFIFDGTTNELIHETALTGVGTPSTAITVTAQTTSTNVFTTSAAHGLAVGQQIFVTSVSTLTALTASTSYYVTSVPSTTTFTLSTLAGSAVTVGTSVTGATASATPYATLETSATPDYDITIVKNTIETQCPIPYLAGTYQIRGTVGTMGSAPFNAGWRVTVHGADY